MRRRLMISVTAAAWAVVLVVRAEGAERGLVSAYIEDRGAQLLGEFADLLRFKNVTREVPQLKKNAEYLRTVFNGLGAEVEVLQFEDKTPVVIGRLEGDPGTETIGIYCHYDGQPTGPRTLWQHEPFEPVLYSDSFENGGQQIPYPQIGEKVEDQWRVYCRAAADDKGPIFSLKVALEALNKAGKRPTRNVVFLFDGQEESGSKNLADYFALYRDRLAGAKTWLICDGPMHQSGQPMIVFGVRGIATLDVTLYGASRRNEDGSAERRPLHSGHYGNWAPNPAMMLSQLLGSMKDAEGRVLVDGFYDTVEPLTDGERQALAEIPNIDQQLMEEFGLARVDGGGMRLEEAINQPSLNVRGLAAAAVGDKARTIVPADATASIDVRLVKGNDPQQMLDLVIDHIRHQGYHIVAEDPDFETRLRHPRIAKVATRPLYRAARTPMDMKFTSVVMNAIRAAEGTRTTIVLQPTMGGSLPLYLFEEKLQRPFLIVPMVNYDNNQHAPNENVRVGNLWYGARVFEALLLELKAD